MGAFISQAVADQLRQFPGPNPQPVQLPDRVVGMQPKQYDDPAMVRGPRSGYTPLELSDLYDFWMRQHAQGQHPYTLDWRRMTMPYPERFGTASRGPSYNPFTAFPQYPMPQMEPSDVPSLHDLLRVLMVR